MFVFSNFVYFTIYPNWIESINCPLFVKDDEADYYDSRRSRHRFDEDLEVEARAEKRILNAKKVLWL